MFTVLNNNFARSAASSTAKVIAYINIILAWLTIILTIPVAIFGLFSGFLVGLSILFLGFVYGFLFFLSAAAAEMIVNYVESLDKV